MRIALIVPTGPRSHLPFDASQLAGALRLRGHEVMVFELRSRVNPMILLTDLHRIRRMLSKSRPQVVHAYYGGVTAAFAIMAALGISEVIVSFRGSDLNPAPNDRRLLAAGNHFASKVAACLATRIICVSPQLKARLPPRAKARADVVRTGVDLCMFKPIPLQEARKALNWPQHVPVVLFNAGAGSRAKRRDLAEAAFERCQRTYRDLRLVVLDGTTPVGVVATMMSAADCLLLTSDYEGSPMIVQQAIACGLPVVSVAVGDVSELLYQVSFSHVVARDITALSEAILKVIEVRARSNGPTIARSKLALPLIAGNVEEIYRKAGCF